jgi:hypothetical protein
MTAALRLVRDGGGGGELPPLDPFAWQDSPGANS